MKTLLIIAAVLLAPAAKAGEVLARPNRHYFSAHLVDGVKHFENNKLFVGKIKKDKKRVDKLAARYTEEIGYGFTSNLIEEAIRYNYLKKGYKLPATMTRQQAHNFLVTIALPTFQTIVLKNSKKVLDHYEREALTLFAYNNGSGALRKLIKRLNDGNEAEMLRVWALYCHADGKKIAGLVRRRTFEINLYKKGKLILANN